MRKPKSDYAIQTVVNAMRVLEAFRDEDELGVTEISRRLDLHKNNVFRLLATLEQQGYIEQSADNERYRLGVRSLELGRSYARSHPLLRRAGAVLEELAARTREAAHLAVMHDFEVVHVYGEQTERAVMSGLRVGRRLPAHCTALGKVLLGCASDAVREAFDRELVGNGGLVQRTPSTIVDPHKLFEHLRTVAVRGFAIDLEECAAGLSCTAAPVFDAEGRLIAALSVSAPRFRLGDGRRLEQTVQMVVAASEQLSRDLGYGI